MTKPSSTYYLSYLLRLYAARSGGKIVWRASLENPSSGEKMSFSSLELLLSFLWDQCYGEEAVRTLETGE